MKTWIAIDDNGINLFSIDFVPTVGMKFRYSFIENDDMHEKFSQDSIEHWRYQQGKLYTVTSVYCDVRNMFGKESLVKFFNVVEVKP